MSYTSQALDTTGHTHIRNIKFDVIVGRSQIEETSLLPKSFRPLKSDQVGENALFEYNIGLDPKQWELQSIKSIVGKTDEIPPIKPVLQPAAILDTKLLGYKWEVENPKKTLIRDIDTGKVWTLPEGYDDKEPNFVTLEDYREGDERQLWRLEIQD